MSNLRTLPVRDLSFGTSTNPIVALPTTPTTDNSSTTLETIVDGVTSVVSSIFTPQGQVYNEPVTTTVWYKQPYVKIAGYVAIGLGVIALGWYLLKGKKTKGI